METELKNWIPTHQGEMLSTGFFHRKLHYSDDPTRDADWVAKESPKYGGVNSSKWQREQEINWEVFGGQRVWPMLSRIHHNAILTLDEGWAVYRIIDHGIRHPTCCLWVAVNRNGDRHVFREYYATDRSVALNCRSILALSKEPVIDTYIDPSVKKRVNYLTTDANTDKQGLVRLLDLYIDNGIQCSLADNCAAGYDKVTDGFLSQLARTAIRTNELSRELADLGINSEQLLMLASKPAITFDLKNTPRAFRETDNLRWKKLTGDISQHSNPEKTVDVADEGPDCVRYAMQSELFWRRPVLNFDKGSYRSTLTKRGLARKKKQYAGWA